MRHLKTYRVFESSGSGLTPEQEEFLNKYTKGFWKYDPARGLVDVDGDFNFSYKGLVNINGIKFGKVSGSFYCFRNKLTSLEGAPQKVGGDFYCSDNKLTSLEGAPQKVGGDFYCYNNKLTSLEGAPQKVGGDFYCYDNKLTSLEGAPQEVGRDFDCYNNKLTSLEGAPQEVGGNFNCYAFNLNPGKWNLEGWLGVLENGSPEARSLILTLISPDVLNRKIQKDPAGMIMKLKGVWNFSDFAATRDKLVWPRGYGEQMDIVGDINTIGF